MYSKYKPFQYLINSSKTEPYFAGQYKGSIITCVLYCKRRKSGYYVSSGNTGFENFTNFTKSFKGGFNELFRRDELAYV